METDSKINHLVADTGAFVKNANLDKIGFNIYTEPGVVSEVRDKATRDRLQVLPYELKLKKPCLESIQVVSSVAKKTGDYKDLSSTDLSVIALTYELEVQFVGKDHIILEPTIQKRNVISNQGLGSDKLVGFYKPVENIIDETATTVVNQEVACQTLLDNLNLDDGDHDEDEDNDESDVDGGSTTAGTEDEEEEEELDDDGWINGGNLESMRMKFVTGDVKDESEDKIQVACITTDFAMQNVLLHMGLKVASVDGFLLKQVRSYVLRCYGCFKTTTIMTKKFCPECGHATLKKIAVAVNPDGSLHYFFSRRVNIMSTKGKTKPIPPMKGGKHSNDRIICEDQRVPDNRLSKKALQKLNALDPDYVVHVSPFAERDVNSRSAVLGIRALARSTRPVVKSSRKKRR